MKRCAEIAVGNNSKRYKHLPEATDDASANAATGSSLLLGSTGCRSTIDPRDAALDLSPSCVITPKNFYTPLSMQIANTSGINVIGVVTHLGDVNRTTTGELCRSVKIVDPSNFDAAVDFGIVYGKGFTVNCFTAKYPGWLPSPKLNDVLILRNIRVSDFNGRVNAVVYKDKLQWAIFSSEAGDMHHGDKGGAPDSESLGDAFGYPQGPFYIARQNAELVYCRQLLDWWDASLSIVQNKLGSIHKIEDSNSSALSRCHRLISEASPYLEPGGFINCTIEVLKIEKIQGGIVEVFATDYSLHPHVGDFFSAELADRVMRIEMNDAAADLEENMKPGDYWFLKNTRVKCGHETSLLEGRLREKKGVENWTPPYFEALLRRKEEWKMANRSSDGHLNHLLITEATEDILFNCTVEVVRAEFNPGSLSYLYITDYTALPSPPTPVTAPGALDNYILKIALSQGQIDMARKVDRGYYRIRKLRLQRLSEGDGFRGRLGGNDTLIHELNPSKFNSQHLTALILRKEAWLAQCQ